MFSKEELFAFQNKKCFQKKKKIVLKEMLAYFSRKGFRVWIQMRKDLRCANNVIGLK